jgi:hypothetical protein
LEENIRNAKEDLYMPGVIALPVIPALGRFRQEDWEF